MQFFRTDDDVELRLTRFNGGPKGPVILSPGFGNSGHAYLMDTIEQNFPEYLHAHGYDVWVLDYRASPSLASAATQFTLDDIAKHDYPAAVAKVREMSGAESVQVMAHCIGSITMLMSLALGLEGVRHGVASQVTLHPRAGTVNEMRAGIYAPRILAGPRRRHPHDRPRRRSVVGRAALRAGAPVYPSGEEACGLPFCRRHDVHVRRDVQPRPAQRRHPRGAARGVRRRQPDDVRADHPGPARGTTSSPPTAPTCTCRRPTGCGCRSPSCTARTTGSSSPRAAS